MIVRQGKDEHERSENGLRPFCFLNGEYSHPTLQ